MSIDRQVSRSLESGRYLKTLNTLSSMVWRQVMEDAQV
jgi:hypothetical protein